MKKTILVVDDEPAIVLLLTYNLQQAGYQVISVSDGLTAVEKVKSKKIDFIIMDLMLPKLDGIEATKKIRKFNDDVPILMLTAKSSEIDKIIGLEIGADDYVTKPFSPKELLSRIKAILRRSNKPANNSNLSEIKNNGNIVIDLKRLVVTKNDNIINLTPNEFKLLKYFFENENQVLSREQILTNVWGYEYSGQNRIVDINVSHLRDKLEDDEKKPKVIKTIRGFGYEFVQEKSN